MDNTIYCGIIFKVRKNIHYIVYKYFRIFYKVKIFVKYVYEKNQNGLPVNSAAFQRY